MLSVICSLWASVAAKLLPLGLPSSPSPLAPLASTLTHLDCFRLWASVAAKLLPLGLPSSPSPLAGARFDAHPPGLGSIVGLGRSEAAPLGPPEFAISARWRSLRRSPTWGFLRVGQRVP